MNPILSILFVLLQDDPQVRLARAFAELEKPDPALLASAKSSPSFGVRYVAALVQIKESLAQGGRHECAHQRIAGLSAEGGPPGAAEHLRALAAAFKSAVYCRDCKDGKVVCSGCQGRKRTEVKCHACEGKGRVGAPGAVDRTQVTMKCRNCDGKAVFKDVRCPACSGTGIKDCPACLGSPWHDRACSVKECRNGRVPCSPCRGKGRVELKCPRCQGRGRVGAPGAIDPSQVTQRCNDCDAKGVMKDRQPCPSCEGSSIGLGLQNCSVCRAGGRKASVAELAAVFETEPCRAGPCATCFGLGVKIRPAGNQAKLPD